MPNSVDPAAFALYLEGQKLFNIIERTNLEAAAARFQAATDTDPGFARAWSHWGYTLAQIAVAGHEPDPGKAADLLAQAEARVSHAIDDVGGGDDYANRWDRAFIWLNQGRTADALAEYEAALELFDNGTDKVDRRKDFLVEMAEAYVYDGNAVRAAELLDRAESIPDWYRWIRAWAQFNARDYAGAIDTINSMHKAWDDPTYVPDCQLLLAAAYAQEGQSAEAAAAMDRLKARRPGWTRERELARNPFRDAADRAHWEEGMTKAGLD